LAFVLTASLPLSLADLSVIRAVTEPGHYMRQQIDGLFGSQKRKREEEDPHGGASPMEAAALFFGIVKHLSSGIDFRKHEVVSVRQVGPFQRNDGPWECGKHAPPRLRIEDPVELTRNLGVYLNKKTQARLHVESARACVLLSDGASWESVVEVPASSVLEPMDRDEGEDV